jgi:hypothetical protein
MILVPKSMKRMLAFSIGSLTGLTLGITGSVIASLLFLFWGDKPLINQAGLVFGGWIMREWDFGCFPQVSFFKSTSLLATASGFKGAAAGLLFDLARAIMHRNPSSN